MESGLCRVAGSKNHHGDAEKKQPAINSDCAGAKLRRTEPGARTSRTIPIDEAGRKHENRTANKVAIMAAIN
jgi:hypothetical protein